MVEVETTIDSIRVAAVSPERMLILKQKGAECYLPFWVSSSQADILAAQLQGRPDKSTEPDHFLANINAADSDIKCVTIHLESNTFCAKILFSHHDKPYEVKCPMAIALTLACRVEAPILVNEALFDKAGVRFPPTPYQPDRKQPWWRRLFKSHKISLGGFPGVSSRGSSERILTQFAGGLSSVSRTLSVISHSDSFLLVFWAKPPFASLNKSCPVLISVSPKREAIRRCANSYT